MGNDTVRWIVLVVLGVPLGALAWHLARAGLGSGSGFTIRARGGGRVEVRGRIPRSKVWKIQEFCQRNLGDVGIFTVRATWGERRVLQLRWTGHLTPGERQRVRNFLVELLG